MSKILQTPYVSSIQAFDPAYEKTYDASTGSLTISNGSAMVNFKESNIAGARANASVTGIWLIIT